MSKKKEQPVEALVDEAKAKVTELPVGKAKVPKTKLQPKGKRKAKRAGKGKK